MDEERKLILKELQELIARIREVRSKHRLPCGCLDFSEEKGIVIKCEAHSELERFKGDNQ